MIKAFLKAVIGFAFPSWATWLLIGGLILAGVGAIYAKGRIDSAHVAEITALKLELDQEREANRKLKEYIARLEKAAKEDADAKAKDDAEITDLKTKLTELVEAVSDPERECFSADDIDRLLDIWGQGKGKGRAGHNKGG